MIRADDGCRLWTADTGRGAPLILCHGGPGLWDMFGSSADSWCCRGWCRGTTQELIRR